MEFEHIFNDLEIDADPFAICELRGRCNVGLARETAATLHYILAGTGEVVIKTRPPLPVAEGSLVVIPGLHSHELRSLGPGGDPMPHCRLAELNLARILKEGDGPGAEDGQLLALCARVTVGLKGAADVVQLIREPLVEHVPDRATMQPLLSALLRELSGPRLGSRAMIRAILLQAMIEMLRRRLADGDAALRWMAALKDPAMWNALRMMLDRPGDPHTVESLAEGVGMSRSTFAKRFSGAYGAGPVELLRDLRMRRAAALLRDTDLPVKRIAAMVGFTSRSAFSRQFEATTGQSPRRFRQVVPIERSLERQSSR